MLTLFLDGFTPLLQRATTPVVLLEGTRQLLPTKRQALVEVGRFLAQTFPQIVFRSGNALGTDEAFAAGVASVPGPSSSSSFQPPAWAVPASHRAPPATSSMP